MYSKVVNVLASTGGGTQDITFTPNSGDPSWTPKVAIVQYNRAVASTSAWIEHQCYGIGWTDGTNQRAVCMVSEDNQAITDTSQLQSESAFITTLTPTGTVGTVDCLATFNSWLTNGIRISWSDAPAAQFYLTILFLGGDDITNTSVGTLTTPTGTGNASITSLSYQPDFAMFLYTNISGLDTPTSNGTLTLGAATSSNNQWVQSICHDDNLLDTFSVQYFDHSHVVVQHDTSFVSGSAAFSSFNSNGFTLNFDVDFGVAYPLFYLTMKGGGYKVGNDTEPGSTGNQTITTGLNTKAVALFGTDNLNLSTLQSDLMWSGGFADNGINQYGHVFNDLFGQSDSVVVSALDGASHIYNNITANATVNSTTWDDSAIVSSVSTTGFVLNWDNVGNARRFRYVAFGEAPPPEPSGMVSKVVTVAASTGGGNQNITFTADPSWTPKAAILQWSRHAIVDDTFQDGFSFGYGFTDGTNSRCVACVSEDATASSDTARIQRNDAVLVALNPSGTITTVDAQASFVGWLSNGMTINWSNAPGSIMPITVTFLGGSAITNMTVGTVMATTGSSCSATGLGYQPEWGMFLCTGGTIENSGTSTTPVCVSVGAVDVDENQWCQTWQHTDGSGSNASRQYYSHTRCITVNTNTISGYSVFGSWDSGGFTITHPATYATSNPIYYIVGKGGEVKVGNSTEPGSTGQQTITTNTDVKSVIIVGNNIGSADTISNGGMWTSGMGDSTLTDKCISVAELWASDPMVTVSRYDTDAIYVNVTPNTTASSSTIDDEASLYGVSSSGFTLDWTNIGQARPFRYICFGGAGLATVTKTLTSLFNLDHQITDTNTLRYDIRVPLTDTNTLRYDILVPIATPKSLTLRHDIRHEVTDINTILFDIEAIAQVIKTLTLLNDIRQELTDTNTLRHDIRQELTDTNTLRHDIRQEVTDTNTLLYNIQQEITDINTLIMDIRQELTDTNTVRYDIRTPLTDTTTIRHDIREAVTDTNTLLFEIGGTLIKTLSLLYDLKEDVTRCSILRQDIRQAVTDTNTIRFDIEAVFGAVVKTLTSILDIRQELTDTNTLIHDIREEIPTKSLTLRADIREATTKTLTLLQHLIAEISKSLTLRHDIRQDLVKTATLLYDLKQDVIRCAILRQDIRHALTDTNTIIFNIEAVGAVIKELRVIFNEVQEVEKSNTLRYDIRAALMKTNTIIYNILQLAEKILTLRSDIREEVPASTSLLFNISQAMLSEARTLIFNILQEASVKTTTVRYNIAQDITKINTILFDIEYMLGVVVKSLTLRSDIREETETDASILFNITVPVTAKQCTMIFNVMEEIAKSNSILFNTLQTTQKAATLKYDITGQITKINTLLYNLRVATDKSVTLRQSIVQQAATDVTVRFDLISQLAKSVTMQYNIYQELIKQHSLLFRITQEIPALSLTLRYDLLSQTTKLLRALYDIRQVYIQTKRIIFHLAPQDLTPKVALHERLLNYIYGEYDINDPPKGEILWHEWYNGQADITIDSIFLTSNTVRGQSTLFYKERVYRCAIHIFFRVAGDPGSNANNPIEYVNVINHLSNILTRSRYSLYTDLGYHVHECRVVDAMEIPDQYNPEHESKAGKIRHYRFLIDLFYQKLLT